MRMVFCIIRATKAGSESALSQIVRLLESSQMAKAPVQKFADHISKYFLPLFIILSLSTWMAWYLAGKCDGYSKSWISSSMESIHLALQFGKSVMVIAYHVHLVLLLQLLSWLVQELVLLEVS